MDTRTEKRNVKTFGKQAESHKFVISEENHGHIINILSKDTYANPILAVVREYYANAVDAHSEINQKRKIDITLPTEFEPKFICRDYGLGLSEEQIVEVFIKYCSSTKNNSNALIGGFGIGAKAGFAYGDNFVIVSYNSGKKVIWNAFKGETGVGEIKKLLEEPSSEPSGLEIIIPVKTNDFANFKEEARFLFSFFKDGERPSILSPANFEIPENQFITEKNFRLSKADDKSRRTGLGQGYGGINYRYGNNYPNSFILMGVVPYELKAENLNSVTVYKKDDLGLDSEEIEVEYLFTREMERLISHGVLIKFNIGDVSPAASRESIQYTDSAKIKIIEFLEKILKEISSEHQSRMDKVKNILEAKTLYSKFVLEGAPSFVYEKIQWNGVKVESNYFNFGEKYRRMMTSFSMNSGRVSRDYGVNSLICSENHKAAFVINDTGSKNPHSRIKELMSSKCLNRIYLFEEKDESLEDVSEKEEVETPFELFKEHLKIPDLRFRNLSDLALPKRVKSKGSESLFKAFVLKDSLSYYSVKYNWIESDIDFKEGSDFFMEINRFLPVNVSSLSDFHLMVNKLRAIFPELQSAKIYGFNKAAMKKKRGKNWKSLMSYIEKGINEIYKNKIQKINFERKKIAIEKYDNVLSSILSVVIKEKALQDIKVFKDLKLERERCLKIRNDEKERALLADFRILIDSNFFDDIVSLQTVKKCFHAPVKEKSKAAKLEEIINKKFPLLKYLCHCKTYNSINSENVINKDFTDYILLMDKLEK